MSSTFICAATGIIGAPAAAERDPVLKARNWRTM
jgi:hypothetical protein